VLLPPHAFAEYERATMIAGGSVVAPIGQSSPWPPDAPVAEVVAGYVRAVGSRAPRVAFLCTPESPSGRAWPLDAVREVAEACRRAGTLLVLDQSFDAFTAAPLGTPALRDHPATLHLRSLTKDHALAGVRLGYLVGLPALVGAVERARMPWSVSAPAQAAAVAVCAVEAEAHVRETTMRLRAAAEELRVAACHLGIPAVPSSAHYFLLDVGDAGAATCTLRQRHAISVRDCTSFGLHGHVRVAARTPGDNRLLLAALRALGATTSNVARPRLTAPRLMSDVSDPTRPAEESPEPAAPGRRRPPRPKQKQPGPYRVPPRERRHGLLIVNTGHGKGKTTAALGILLRAAGRGMRVGMFQFIKSAKNPYGEHTAAALLGVEIVPLGDGFTWLSENIAEDRALAERGWERCREALARGEYDVLILDELTYALKYGWLDTDAVIAAIRARPVGTHVVVTGRDAPDALVAAADLVTEMRLVKHPYREQGIGAQPGIEL
jgi:cob(I)alamin adenosyltransferase